MGQFEVSRSRHVSASPERVHAAVDDFRQWVSWSPWEGLDPELSRTYSGPPTGAGARYAWTGNKKAGSGHMEIVSSSPERIVVDVTFTAPFESENTSTFTIRPASDGGSDVTWTMTGPQSAAQRVLFTVLRMNTKVAKDFDTGLAALDAATQS